MEDIQEIPPTPLPSPEPTGDKLELTPNDERAIHAAWTIISELRHQVYTEYIRDYPNEEKDLAPTNEKWRHYECRTILLKFRSHASEMKDMNGILLNMVWAEIANMCRAFEDEFVIAMKRSDKRKIELVV